MTRLTDAEIAEYEDACRLNLKSHEAFRCWDRFQVFMRAHGADVLAELRALRKVREAADAYRLVVARFNTSYQEDGQSSIELDHAEAALSAALDEARGAK